MMKAKIKLRVVLPAALVGLFLLGLWLFLPRKVFWVELGSFGYQPGPMSKPSTVVARPVSSIGQQLAQLDPKRISFYDTDFLERKYYHLWALDTTACNFFMWTRRNRNLIHLGGPEISVHLLRFAQDGKYYVGEHDFKTISNIVPCTSGNDDEAVFMFAAALAKNRMENHQALGRTSQ